PSCAGKACGESDGCGGVCNSGACGTGQRCVIGVGTCDPTSCAGCCAGSICKDGNADGECGHGGTVCATCPSGVACGTGTCGTCGGKGQACCGGACAAPLVCNGGTCGCTPSCAGKA